MWISLVVQHSRIHLPIQGTQVQPLLREPRSHIPRVYPITREEPMQTMKTQHNQKMKKEWEGRVLSHPYSRHSSVPPPKTAPGLVFDFPQVLTGRTEELYHFNSHNTIIM